MRKHLPILFALFLSASLLAQNNQPIVLVSAQGKIKYTSPGATTTFKIRAGAALKPTGTLNIKKGAAVVLYCQDQFIELKKPGNYVVGNVCTQESSRQSLKFEQKLGDYVLAGVELANHIRSKGYSWIATVVDPKSSGDGWGTGVSDPKTGSSGWGTGVSDPKTGSSGWGNAVSDPKTGSSGWGTGVTNPKTGSSGWGTGVTDPKTGSSGWGTATSSIVPILPFGKITPASTTFFWSNPGKNNIFHFEITDELNKSLYVADVRDSFFVLNVATLNLKEGEKYHWKVSVPGKPGLGTIPLGFEIGSDEKRIEVLNLINTVDVLKTSSDVALRRVAEAVALERADWYYSAYEVYESVRRTNPNNLTRMMHAAFWMRYGLPPMAEKAAQK